MVFSQYGSECGGEKEDRADVPWFDESNVEQWIEDFETFLMRKEQSEVALERPPEEEDFGIQPLNSLETKSYKEAVDKYWKANAIAYSYCREAVKRSPKALQKFHLKHKEFKAAEGRVNKFSAREMVSTLKSCFEGGTQNKISALLAQFGSFEMKPGETAKEYVLRFELLLRELQAHNQTVTEESKISRLKEGIISDEYDGLNYALYLMPDDVPYELLSKRIEQFDDTKYGRKIIEKKRKSTEELNHIEKPRKKERVSTKRKCTYCSKKGIIHNHNTEQCRKKKGETKGQRPGSKEYTGCRVCKSKNHRANECPRNSTGKTKKPQKSGKVFTFENIRRGGTESDSESEANMLYDCAVDIYDKSDTCCMIGTAEHYTYIDTCCSSSMFLMNDVTMLDTHMNTSKVINGSKKGSEIHITSVGSRGAWRDIEISDQINRCLCSGRKLNEMGYRFTVWYGIQIYDCNTGELVLEGPMKNGMTAVPTQQLLELPDVSTPSNCEVNLSDRTGEDELELLHRRAGHFNKHALVEAHKRMLIMGTGLKRKHLTAKVHKNQCLCDVCARSKITRVSFRTKDENSVRPNFSADIAVYLNCPARGGERYVLKITHHASKMFWATGLVHRTGEAVLEVFKELFRGDVKRYKLKMEHYHADGAGELISEELRQYLRTQECYQHTWSSTDSPEMNAIEERKFRTAGEMTLAMLIQSGLPPQFWLDAYMAARYILIRLPTKTDKGYMSPIEFLTGEPPNLRYLRVWGCRTYVLSPKADRRKDWEDKALVGYLMGYSDEKVGYHVYLPESNKVVTTVHILTDESTPSRSEKYFAEIDALRVREAARPKLASDYVSLEGTYHIDDEDGLLYKTTRVVERKGVIVAYRSLVTAGREHIEHRVPIHVEDVVRMTAETPGNTGYIGKGDALSTTPARELDQGRPGGFQESPDPTCQQTVVRLQTLTDRGSGDASGAPPTPQDLRAQDEQGMGSYISTRRPIELDGDGRVRRKRLQRRLANASVLGEINMVEVPDACTVNFKHAEFQHDDFKIPDSYAEAERSPQYMKWREARKVEKTSLLKRRVLKIVRTPRGVKLVRAKYVHTVKRDLLGNVVKYKARLVALGNLQEKTEEEQSTFAPVVKGITIRLVLAIAFMFHMHVHQLDVSSAFCYADLEEDVYMAPPPDEELPAGWCFQLIKALYGLRSSPRQWNKHIDKFIKSLHFTACILDTCLYMRWSNGQLHLLLIYVDDIIIASADLTYLESVKRRFCETFEMHDLGVCKRFLNIRITRGEDWYMLDQSEYAKNIVKKFSSFMGKSSKNKETPLPTNVQDLLAEQRELTEEQKQWVESFPYRGIIGAVLHLAIHTRPDLAYAVGLLARFSTSPTYATCRLAIHLLKYLRGTVDKGIRFSGSEFDLHVFSDSDWAGDRMTRRSTTGYIVLLCAGALAWQSKLQTTVATSSMESEYMAEYAALQELVWLRGVFKELGLLVAKPTPFFMDSKSAKDLSENPVYHKRSKHIDIKYHWIREHVNGKFPTAKLIHVSTDDMAADIFTKALSTKIFSRHEKTITGVKRSVSNSVEEQQKKRPRRG